MSRQRDFTTAFTNFLSHLFDATLMQGSPFKIGSSDVVKTKIVSPKISNLVFQHYIRHQVLRQNKLLCACVLVSFAKGAFHARTLGRNRVHSCAKLYMLNIWCRWTRDEAIKAPPKPHRTLGELAYANFHE